MTDLHAEVVAQHPKARHGDRTAMQRRQHTRLAIERVGGLEQFAGRLRAQDVAPAVRLDAPDRIGIAADEALRLAQPMEAFGMYFQP